MAIFTQTQCNKEAFFNTSFSLKGLSIEFYTTVVSHVLSSLPPVTLQGNSNVLNIDSRPGSVGFTSVLLPFVYPVSLIRFSSSCSSASGKPQ